MLFGIALFELVFYLADILFPHLLHICKYCFLHRFRRNKGNHIVIQILRRVEVLVRVLFLSAFGYDFIKEFNNLSIHSVRHINGFNHFIFRYLVGSRLNHNHLIPCGSNRKRQIRNLSLFGSRVHDKLVPNQTNLCRRRRAIKWNIRNARSKCGAKHRRQFRTAVLVYTHNQIFQRYVISVILWKKRTHGTVNDTAGQNRVVRRLSLSPRKTTRYLSYCIHFFIIFYTEWEKINPLPWLLRRSCRTQYNCISIMHKCCTIRLCGNSSNIYRKSSSSKLH